ncbi:membrane protein [gut metagenome]|uniref:Membrane protein n=1 Tax=gut metagenome TaxID=749906 RepID=J9GY06_9ZZZZ
MSAFYPARTLFYAFIFSEALAFAFAALRVAFSHRCVRREEAFPLLSICPSTYHQTIFVLTICPSTCHLTIFVLLICPSTYHLTIFVLLICPSTCHLTIFVLVICLSTCHLTILSL